MLLCDDSLVVRSTVRSILARESDIEVAVSVSDGAAAVEAVRQHREIDPIDVVLLDLEMPVMDGMTALPKLLLADPAVRVIVASAATRRGAAASVRALALGAADYLPKPGASRVDDEEFRRELVSKVRAPSRRTRTRFGSTQIPPYRAVSATTGAAVPALTSGRIPRSGALPRRRFSLVAIGSSTGGPQALLALVRRLGPGFPLPVAVTQHMPSSFVAVLAEQLNALGVLPCAVATEGCPISPGRLLIAPGDRHLVIEDSGSGLVARLSEAPPENFCRPAVDVMLRTAAAACPGAVLAVILTGMGRDGLEGTRRVVSDGGLALAQDEATSVVWGMPGAIAAAGLASSVMPLESLGEKISQLVTAP